ncbi:hypothetical protein PENTCL1PPCAC_10658 [Pristionchus entomophagus]|uniref:Ubiquitin-like protease family profile domain-containing protein n=1 Tax=Pristionchus entomophagus TaxID=358040 RepID=A0AAV5T6M8_9BILA|nr:hypothetical protein PENTCL1PPCAC_10658 [Pristionchus entomophagus]
MSEAHVAHPLRSQAHDTQRKRAQLDASRGPPPKKSMLSEGISKVWWTIKSVMPWRRDYDEEEEDERVVAVEDEERDEDENEEEVEVVNDEDDDDVIPLPVPVQSLSAHRVANAASMGGSSPDKEQQVMMSEVREEEVLIVETPEKTTVYTRRISPSSTTGAVASTSPHHPQMVTLDSPLVDNDTEVVEVVPTTPSCSSSSRVFGSSQNPPHYGLSPEVTHRVMEYVTEQSSRVVTVHSGASFSAHSPSQSSTASADRERLRVGEEGETGERDYSPLPEDSASRQVTPKSVAGAAGVYAGTKRDTWRKKDSKREQGRDPYRMVGRSRVIGRMPSSTLTKKISERLRPVNSHRHSDSNPYDEEAKLRYLNIMKELSGRTSGGGGAEVGGKKKPPVPFTFRGGDLSTRQKLGLDDHKKRLAMGTSLALGALDEMFPPRRGERRNKYLDDQDSSVAGPSHDSTILLDDSSRDCSMRSLNSSSLSFHSVDKLADLQSRIHEMSLISTSGRLQYDLYKGSKADFDATVSRLGEEGEIRKAHRLETERLYHIDVKTRLGLQGITVPEPEKAVDEFPELSEEVELLCSRVWSRGGSDGEQFRGGDPPLTRKDLKTLYGPNWLNDEVILAYFNLIVERSKNDQSLPKVYAFNTFFYGNISNRSKGFPTVKRWTKKVDIFSFDILLIPVHLSVHWTMAVVDVVAKTIQFYDSLGGGHREVGENIMQYLEAESMDKRKIPLSECEWERESLAGIPQQHNGSDCGVFACKFADFAARRAPVTFDQSHMPYYRKRMVYQLCQSDLAAH